MAHGITWLTFLPGYQQMEAYLQSRYSGVLGGQVMLQHVAAAVLVALVMLIVAWHARGDMRRAGDNGLVPAPNVSIRNVLEVVLEAMYGQMQQIIGPQCQRYFPVLGTFALFILFSNLLGLIPGFVPPTDNWNTTFACGIFVFIYFNFHGLRENGWSYLAHIANPAGVWWGWFLAPLMLPIEVVSICARPFSLGVRLAANMVGDHAVLLGFLSLVPIIVPLPFMVLGLMVSVVQTVVFVLLSMVYLGLATANSHSDDAAHAS